jgi:hypothetical protein
MKVTFRDICWFVVITFIMLYLSRCHGNEKSVLKDEVSAIKQRLEQDSLSYVAESLLWEGRLLEQEGKTNEAIQERENADAKLAFSEKTINRLAAAIKAAKLLPFDTSFVTVSPEYVTYCDSLAEESEDLLIDLNNLKKLNTHIVVGKTGELAIKDSIIKVERNLSTQYRSRYTDLEVICAKAMEINKPKNQVYIGAEILGNQNTILQNVGAVISLKTKRNKLWQISSGLQSNGLVYGRINGNILISFK